MCLNNFNQYNLNEYMSIIWNIKVERYIQKIYNEKLREV